MVKAALISVLLALGFSVGFGISKSYDVVPFGDCVAQIVTAPNGGITQYLRNTLDSLDTISVWVGDTLTSEAYVVEVRDSANPLHLVAHNWGFPVAQCWSWLKIPLTEDAKPVRGRTYYVRISRSGGGGISFAYDPRNPYTFGKAVVSNSGPSLPDGSDLALRVEGLHDTIGSDWLSVQVHSSGPENALALAKDELGVTWVGA